MRKICLLVSFFIITPVFLFSLLFAFLTVSYSLTQPSYISSHHVSFAALPTNDNLMTPTIVTQDARVAEVRAFLEQYNSPLAPHAAFIVETADQYEFDYRYIPAIAMQESNLCKRIPPGSNNCWGFGIYGDKITRFKDYKEGIETVTKALAVRYKSLGLETPEQIMTRYTPGSNGSWARGVTQFMDVLEIVPTTTILASDAAN